MKILKFGGTSIKTPDRVINVAKIIKDELKHDENTWSFSEIIH